MPNVDQMHCYMTINLHRLCEPEERAHLMATIGRFEEDYGVWSRKALRRGDGLDRQGARKFLRDRHGGRRDGTRDGRSQAIDEERQKKIDKFEKTMGYVLDEPNKILAESKNDTPHYQLEYDLTALAPRG